MKNFALGALSLVLLFSLMVTGQTPKPETPPTEYDALVAEKAFKAGNELMEQQKYAEALAKYQEGLKAVPDSTGLLYNAAQAAFLIEDFKTAATHWGRMRELEPGDWQVRAKLVQTYQALSDLPARDAERQALFDMKKRGKNEDLKERDFYCREQMKVNGQRVIVFEHFELKGPRGLRYVFTVLNEAGDKEAFRISLGSYDLTNNIWRETTKPAPKENERLFHLDGYFPGGGHATYGMYPPPELTYDKVREIVISILEKKKKPLSSSAPAKP
jgi:tetratricopeptide (TPR) repeat protein